MLVGWESWLSTSSNRHLDFLSSLEALLLIVDQCHCRSDFQARYVSLRWSLLLIGHVLVVLSHARLVVMNRHYKAAFNTEIGMLTILGSILNTIGPTTGILCDHFKREFLLHLWWVLHLNSNSWVLQHLETEGGQFLRSSMSNVLRIPWLGDKTVLHQWKQGEDRHSIFLLQIPSCCYFSFLSQRTESTTTGNLCAVKSRHLWLPHMAAWSLVGTAGNSSVWGQNPSVFKSQQLACCDFPVLLHWFEVIFHTFL